jgi:hypothetical protein
MGWQWTIPTIRRARRYALIVIAQFLLAATCSGQTGPRVDARGDTLIYRGDLTSDGLRQPQTTHNATEHTPRWLEIDSGGGEVNVAMDFGDWIFHAGLGVRVSNRCLSACANYVFPAAPVKVIEPQAIVAWHGSAIQTEAASRAAIDAVIERDVLPGTDPRERDAIRSRLIADTLAYLALAEARQAAFFRRLGVDERITRVGLDHPAVTDFWFLSVAAMARFGIDRVVAPSNDAATDTSRFGPGKVVYIEPAARP